MPCSMWVVVPRPRCCRRALSCYYGVCSAGMWESAPQSPICVSFAAPLMLSPWLPRLRRAPVSTVGVRLPISRPVVFSVVMVTIVQFSYEALETTQLNLSTGDVIVLPLSWRIIAGNRPRMSLERSDVLCPGDASFR